MTWTLPAVVATGGMIDVAWGRQVAENVGWWQATRVCSTSGQWPMAWLSGSEPQYNVQGDVSPEMIYQSAGTWAAWFQMGNQHQPSTAFVPVGTICWFYGNLASLPSCWKLADGTNGTLDLRARFILGAGATYAVGATRNFGPDFAHTHTVNAAAESAHSHSVYILVGDEESEECDRYIGASYGVGFDGTAPQAGEDTNRYHLHEITATFAAGVSHSHAVTAEPGNVYTADTAPPYRALYLIQKVSVAT